MWRQSANRGPCQSKKLKKEKKKKKYTCLVCGVG